MKVLIYEIQQSKPEITKNDMKSLLKNFKVRRAEFFQKDYTILKYFIE